LTTAKAAEIAKDYDKLVHESLQPPDIPGKPQQPRRFAGNADFDKLTLTALVCLQTDPIYPKAAHLHLSSVTHNF
jgi:hypothetical protein